MRVLPVVLGDVVQPIDDVVVRTSIASSRRPSRLPGARLIEPTIAATPSASSILACSLRSFSLCTLIPTSSMIRSPPTPSTSFSRFSVCGGRART